MTKPDAHTALTILAATTAAAGAISLALTHLKPRWSVTWPIRPHGVMTSYVRANDTTDAVRIAGAPQWPTGPDEQVAFDYTPEVWRLRRPHWFRSLHAAGPHYPDTVPGQGEFTPLPQNTEATR